jgi:hypothetical protein
MSDKIKIEITFGIGENKHRQLIVNLTEKEQKIGELAVALFGGYTWHNSVGGWANDNGQLITEVGCVLFVIASDSAENRRKARQLALSIRDTLEQTSVLLTITQCESSYV